MSIALRYAARSDIGLVRSNNQDSAYAGPHLLMVADGMGGHAGGDVASSIAVAALAPLDDEAHGPDDALDELDAALHAAQDELLARAKADADLGGMGTTVTALLRAGNKLVMAHIGDSRAYLLRDGAMHRLTRDHSLGQAMADAGVAGRRHPMRGVLTRALGAEAVAEPDLVQITLRVGDRVLLCSDGLTDMVDDATIADIFAAAADAGAATQRLTERALAAGGFDNFTALAVFIDEAPAR